MEIDLRVSRSEAAALLALAERVCANELTAPDENYAATRRALARLRREIGLPPEGGEASMMHRFTAVLAEVTSSDAADMFTRRVRDLLSIATLWIALEGLHRRVKAEGRSEVAEACTALLDLEQVNEIGWCAEALDLLDANFIRVTLPGDPPPADAA